jgi:hypothetical protein
MMSRNSEQIAIAEAVTINDSIEDSIFTNSDLQLIIKLAWAARKRSADEKASCFDHVKFIMTEAARRSRQTAEDGSA